MFSWLATALAALSMAPMADGHSWVEQLRNINSKGTYVGEYGYPRGFVGKTDPGFNGDVMNWLLPQPTEKTTPWIGNETMLCHQNQRQPKQSQDKYPRLQAVPGGFMAMRYMENGHVTLLNDPTNSVKAKKAGTIFVYGTTDPKEDEKLADVLQWTQDGQGGDKRGVLIGANDFDDGRCYETPQVQNANAPEYLKRKQDFPNFAMGQVSEGAGNMPLYCETDIALPQDAPKGKTYTLYWVWQWNTYKGKDPQTPTGKDQYYTTCIDVDVVDVIAHDTEAKFALGQQDAMTKAAENWKSRTALYTDAVQGNAGPLFDGKTATGAPTGGGDIAAPEPIASKPATLSSARAPQQTTLATKPAPSSGSPPAAGGIPNLTTRPGRPQPSNASGGRHGGGNGNNNNDDDVVTVTNTVMITVVAGAVTSPSSPRASHVARHGAKFRGRFAQD